MLKFSPHERARATLNWFRNNPIITLIIALMGGIILLSKTSEGISKLISPFVRASSDASQVAQIRKEVEQQRDAIAIIARDANAAQTRIEAASAIAASARDKAEAVAERSEEIQQLANSAASSVQEIKTIADFAFLLARTAADDRSALDDLLKIMDQSTHSFRDLAQSALLRIAGEGNPPFGLEIDWKKVGIDPAKADFSEIVSVFETRPTFDKPMLLIAIWHQQRFTTYDRLTFLRDVMLKTNSIAVLAAACRAMDEEAKISKNVLGYRDYLDWWTDHIRQYTPAADSPSPVPAVLSTP